MSAVVDARPARRARTFRLYRNLPRLLRDPMREIEEISRLTSSGELIQVDFGVFRAYVASHPDDVQHILRDNSANFLRDGTFWRPLHRLFGDSVMGEGPDWSLSRKALLPVLNARSVNSVASRMADTINEAINALDEPARSGQPIDATREIAKIVNQTVLKIFFGDKISAEENAELAPAFDSVAVAIAFRFLLPFLPASVPVPGDRAFKQAVQRIDNVLYPLIRKQRREPDEGRDFFTALCRARDGEVTDQWIRNNLVSMFATGTETTVGALAWLWPVLDTRPDVAARLYEEIDTVVGRGPVRAEHRPGLVYTKQVVAELLRRYPTAWLFPRLSVEAATLGGVPIKAGSTVLLSPYLTHRLAPFWPRPLEFDPDRFGAERGRRHRYAYFPFGGGPHQCIGMHVFNVEIELIIAGVLSRFRPVSCTAIPDRPQIGPILRPRRSVEMTLRPV
jgi:enediyne biosynthesis protein E7